MGLSKICLALVSPLEEMGAVGGRWKKSMHNAKQMCGDWKGILHQTVTTKQLFDEFLARTSRSILIFMLQKLSET